MKFAFMISTAFVASVSAFAPRTNVAFHAARKAYSSSTAAMMANPKGKSASRVPGPCCPYVELVYAPPPTEGHSHP